jgi:hypothetical protein
VDDFAYRELALVDDVYRELALIDDLPTGNLHMWMISPTRKLHLCIILHTKNFHLWIILPSAWELALIIDFAYRELALVDDAGNPVLCSEIFDSNLQVNPSHTKKYKLKVMSLLETFFNSISNYLRTLNFEDAGKIIRRRESLVLYKSFNTLWREPKIRTL